MEELINKLKNSNLKLIEKETGIPYDRMYKWIKGAARPKLEDYNILLKYFNHGNTSIDEESHGRLSEHISTYGVKDKPEPARAYDLKDKVIDNLLEQLELLKKELAEMKAKETKD